MDWPCDSLQWFGVDYDSALAKASHSFGSSDFFAQIRRQPCMPLVRMLRRRIGTFERARAARLRRRVARGRELSRSLPDGMVVGEQNAIAYVLGVAGARGQPRGYASGAAGRGVRRTLRSSLIEVPNPNHHPVAGG